MKSSNHQQLAMNSLNNLRGFASKMQQQARDVAKKLPSLDEMAAKDGYIHTEEFNVKGEKREEEERKAKVDEERPADMPSSWSLIDKHIFQKEEESAAERVPLVQSSIPTRRDEKWIKSNQSQNGGKSIPVNDASSETATRKPRSVMMSVVTDAMTATPASPEKEVEEDENSIVSDSSSDSDGDEEDPILSMIRQDKGEEDKVKKKAPKPKKKKKPSNEAQQPKMHRFLSDMAAAENQLETDKIQANEEQAPKIAIALPGTPKELGSWMKNMASNQMNKILKRPEPLSEPASAAPPLASTWRSKPAPKNPLQEEYHSQDSTDLLGDNELKQLAKLKQANSGGNLRLMICALYEYRQFAFIAFTLVLAGVVYFFKFGALEDGVI